MILSSCVSEEKYFWIKIPRTGTHSFKFLFEQYNENLEEFHSHKSYQTLCTDYGESYPGVSVVRHPLTKFISCIYYIFQRQSDTTTAISNLWKNTDACIALLNNTFARNCITTASFKDIFLETEESKHLRSYQAFFKPQTYFAYHPKVKIFYYEDLIEFKNWIKNNLGYDTCNIQKLNYSSYEKKLNIDFNSREFIETVENLFYDDYKVFGYPLQYLT